MDNGGFGGFQVPGRVGFTFGPAMDGYMQEVRNTLREQPDFKGWGGHLAEDHHGHGNHVQINMGVGPKDVAFRRLW